MIVTEAHTTLRRHGPRRHGFQAQGAGGEWWVWGPHAKSVELVLIDGSVRRAIPMTADSEGWHHVALEHVDNGQRYLFRLNGMRELPDPASRWQPEGVHAPSAVWRDDVERPVDPNWFGVRLEDMVLYELHVGTFTSEGTFDAVIPRLSELKDLGITAIELMPVAEFPGKRGWGYDGTYWFATQSSYGGPAGLARLIAACHRAGLAVLLDVVFNHLGPEGNYLSEFGPHFTSRHHTPWGAAVNLDDEHAHGMRSLILDAVRYWIGEVGFDGLRLDAVHALNDDSPQHILTEIQQVANAEASRLGRRVVVIAESDWNDVVVLDSPLTGGYGLDAQWNDDFHHCVHALLTGERDGYYGDFDDPMRQLLKACREAFVYNGQPSRFRGVSHGKPIGTQTGERFVIYAQNHDQVGNRARGDRFGTLLCPSRCKLAAGLVLLAPRVPLIFMGEEYGETRPFPFFCDYGDPALREAARRGRREEFARFAWQGDVPDPAAAETFESAILSWDWAGDPVRAGLRTLYQRLLTLREQSPALRDYIHFDAELFDERGRPGDGPILVWERGDPTAPAERLWMVFNLGAEAVCLTDVFPSPGPCVLRSDDPEFGPPEEGRPLVASSETRLPGHSFAVFQALREAHS